MRRHQLLAFFALTYAISWAIWISLAIAKVSIATTGGRLLNIVAISGPSIAALVLAAALGREELRNLLSDLSLSRVSARWSLVALVLPQLMIAVAIAISVIALGGSAPVLTAGLVGTLVAELARIFFLGGPLGEELGWRGFALPRLQLRRTALGASVLLGLIWGLWHIPLYFVPGTGQFETISGGTDPAFAIGAFAVWTVGLSVLFTWLFNETRGSVIVVMLLHASVDLGAFVPSAVQSAGAVSLLYALITLIVALVVVIRYGRTALASRPRVTVGEDA